MTLELAVLIPCSETSRWRRALNSRLPMNSRNGLAADMLDRLAEQLETLEDSDLHRKVAALWQRKAGEQVQEAITDILRNVGIGWAPSADELVGRVVDVLEELDDEKENEWDDVESAEFDALTKQVELLADARALTLASLISKASLIADWLGAELDSPADFQDRAVFSVLKDLLAMRRCQCTSETHRGSPA